MNPFATIRNELPGDRAAVRAVNEVAFGQPAEADLVEALHDAGAATVALVAELDGEIVGHIMFTPVALEPARTPRLAMPRLVGLGPMAVLPHRQRQGVGSQLVREGLRRCRDLGVDGVVLVGHAEYYPRFGFRPASELGLSCAFEVPPECFMVLELEEGALGNLTGLVRYQEAFSRF